MTTGSWTSCRRRRWVRAARLRFTAGLIVYVIAFGLSWVSPLAALSLHGAMALYYAFDQASVSANADPDARSR